MERSKQSTIAIIICIAVSNLCTAATAKIIYVDDDANGLNDGLSWQSACRFLQDALANAKASDKPVEVHVAQGMYRPDQGTGIKARDYKATFQLINGIALRGGYAGLIEPDPNVRDIKLYETILSGDLGADDPDVNETAELFATFVGPNSDTVVTGSGTDDTAILDGFTITAGYHYLDPIRDGRGPGIPSALKGWGAGMNNCAGSPTIVGCTFIGNMTTFSGAAMCNVEGSHPSVVDCVFVDNYAVAGGAMANWNDGSPTLTRCTFRENIAGRQGGAVHSHRSSPTFKDCTFVGNAMGPISGTGGAIYNDTTTSTLADCTFTENEAASGGAIHSQDNDNLSLERCTFVGNFARMGGAIYGWGKNNNFVLNACTFTRNVSRGGAGAVYSYGQGQFSGCTFNANTSRGFGGAVNIRTGTFARCLFLGNRALDDGAGGAVYSGGSLDPLHFVNCTFAENYARWSNTLWIWTGEPTEVHNCILRGPQPLIWADTSEPQPRITYCDIEGTWPGEGNIDADPLFAKPGRWADPDDPNSPGDPNDPNTIWVDGDYHLKSLAGRWDPNSQRWVADDVTSPCIDAGDPNSPVGDEPLPNGGRINMGAYGGTTEASKTRLPKTFDERLKDLLATIEGQSKEQPKIRKARGYIHSIWAPANTHFAVDPDYQDTPETAATWFLQQWRDLFVNPSDALSFEVIGISNFTYCNCSLVRYQQKYAGLPIYNADMGMEVGQDGGVNWVVSGSWADTSALDAGTVSLAPSIDAPTAQGKVIAFLGTQYAWTTLEASPPILMIYIPSLLGKNRPIRLVWQMDVHDPGGFPAEQVLMDAHNGEIALHFSTIDSR